MRSSSICTSKKSCCSEAYRTDRRLSREMDSPTLVIVLLPLCDFLSESNGMHGKDGPDHSQTRNHYKAANEVLPRRTWQYHGQHPAPYDGGATVL